MKRPEQPSQLLSPTKTLRMQSAGLYGEIGAPPVSRAVPERFSEPKTFR